ncbi:unnamed protein product [[Candida] boidinii]|uniref:Unnamed protein product n=1 Tax=Candida boidinii TaxID=5477 RepID=A0A9W6SVS1_CANBO|nr:unnamed protein product [[Candida] boidinii]
MNPQFPTEKDQHLLLSNMESVQFYSQQQQQKQHHPPVYAYATNIVTDKVLPQQQNQVEPQFPISQNDQHYIMSTGITEINENKDAEALNQIKEMTDFSKLDKFKLNPQNIVSEIVKYTSSEPQFDKFFHPLDENSPNSQHQSPPLQEQQTRQQSKVSPPSLMSHRIYYHKLVKFK